MLNQKKIVFLETHQNHVWTSMQEILPHIHQVWSELTEEEGADLITFNVDKKGAFPLKEVMSCDLLIVSAFNTQIVGALLLIRQKLGIKVPMYFYLHGLATVGLWPLAHFGLWSFLLKDDRFLGTCEGDKECLKALGLTNFISTFFASEDNSDFLPQLKGEEEIKDILFIGRISEQKNLKVLIKAFQNIASDRPHLRLHLYGKEDFLGSPNMGIVSGEYLKELKELSDEKVLFHGFCSRDKIKEQWKDKPFIFCSPSLHSDENFGMAALMALELGGRVVLSRWGGHQNFLALFPKRSFGVTVHHREGILSVDQRELEEKMEQALKGDECPRVASPFHRKAIKENLLSSIKWNQGPSPELKVSAVTQKIIGQREKFQAPNQQKIFFGYDDPLAKVFFKAYGAQD